VSRDWTEHEKNNIGMIDELLNYDGESGNRELTAWEIEFLQSINGRARDFGLTAKQDAKLSAIWQSVFA